MVRRQGSRGEAMADSTIDSATRQAWKSIPLRVVFGSSSCCNAPTILANVAPSSFVMRRCTECSASETLTNEQFHCLELWVACPKCNMKMKPGREFYEKYA